MLEWPKEIARRKKKQGTTTAKPPIRLLLALLNHASPLPSSTPRTFPRLARSKASPRHSPFPFPPSSPPSSRNHQPAKMSQEFTYQDVAEHNTKKDVYLVIHDKVYDSTKFVDEHP